MDDCVDIKAWYGNGFKNLTFDTNKNQQDGRVVHVSFDKLFIELIPGKCEFGMYLVYDPNFMSEKFIFGTKFLTSYQSISFNYEDQKLGLKGYLTNSTKYIPPPPTPKPDKPDDQGTNNDKGERGQLILLLAGIAGGIIVITVVTITCIKMRRKRIHDRLVEANAGRDSLFLTQ
jgi:hypothetical protein